MTLATPATPATQPTLILASRSPRRAELLRQVGIPFQVCASDIDETPRPAERPFDYARRMAREKALAARRGLAGASLASSGTVSPGMDLKGLWLLGADTAVVAGDRILGKPLDEADARSMLRALSDRTHEVFSAVALVAGGGNSDGAGPGVGANTSAGISASAGARLATSADATGRVGVPAVDAADAGPARILADVSVTRVTFCALEAAAIDAYLATEEPWDKAGAYAIQGWAARFIRRIEGSYSGVVGLPLFETCALLDRVGIRAAQDGSAG